VEVAALHLGEVQLIGGPVRGGTLLEQKDLEEPPHQRIAAQIVAQCGPLLGQLFLHAADEEAQRCHTRRVLPVSSSCIMPCFRSRVLARRASRAATSASMSESAVAMAVCSSCATGISSSILCNSDLFSFARVPLA